MIFEFYNVLEDGEHLAFAWSEINAECFVKRLNELYEEVVFYKKQVDELDGLLNQYQVTFEELEEILDDRLRF